MASYFDRDELLFISVNNIKEIIYSNGNLSSRHANFLGSLNENFLFQNVLDQSGGRTEPKTYAYHAFSQQQQNL